MFVTIYLRAGWRGIHWNYWELEPVSGSLTGNMKGISSAIQVLHSERGTFPTVTFYMFAKKEENNNDTEMSTRSNRLARKTQNTCSDWCPGWRLAESPIGQPMYIWAVQGLRSGCCSNNRHWWVAGWQSWMAMKLNGNRQGHLCSSPDHCGRNKEPSMSLFFHRMNREKEKTVSLSQMSPSTYRVLKLHPVWLSELHYENVNVCFFSRNVFFLWLLFTYSKGILIEGKIQIGSKLLKKMYHLHTKTLGDSEKMHNLMHSQSLSQSQRCSVLSLKSCNLKGCWGDLCSVVCESVWFSRVFCTALLSPAFAADAWPALWRHDK